MIITPRKAVVLATVATVAFSGGGVATADEPAEVTAYSCDALTSADVPAVRKRLADQGIDVSTVTGPIGLSCRKTGHGSEVEVSVTGVDGVAYRCASAEDKNGTKVVFFADCGQSTSVTA
ncbi:hypothetical protein [Actinophytocola algeriensis]|uniref:Subtilisin inhibitor-like n=1 Tax=Actinophytocola algeriensis TaxID=1768010 RepID=A0A7W7Q7X5_9PSEU|nr:hypothetical protein [Actinophytocola algeriensis]MBB4908587.1 hypothetical protein [Actinophytocola algeriensis]MBE1475026.1 hypothetical protein [Actinophytocola algeriensis]